MHYRHHFHAGNFADVFKHVLLVGLVEALKRKDKPFCYLDTHAGAGAYNLASNDADRTGEWREGIGRLHKSTGAPPTVARYLQAVAWSEDTGQLKHSRPYPGSPRLVADLARAGDRVVCCEKVPDVAAQLRAHLPLAEIHIRDGYEAHGLLPPREKRGLVLVDPPFESRREFEQAQAFLEQAIERFASGIYALWFPMKNRHDAERFTRRAGREREALVCTLDTDAPGEGQMRACGLLVINPPFGFADEARAVLAWLAPRLAQGPRPAWSVDAPSSTPTPARSRT